MHYTNHIQELNAAVANAVALVPTLRTPLPVEPAFTRESTDTAAYSNIIATLTGILRNLPEDVGTFLTLRIKHNNSVAIAYLPSIFGNEKFTVTAQAQWEVPTGEKITLEVISTEACTLHDAHVHILCADTPSMPQEKAEARSVSGGAQARNPVSPFGSVVICSPVLILKGTDYIAFIPESPGVVAVTLVNGE
jgi:hypothetical protein